MGWLDYHPWEMAVHGQIYGPPTGEGAEVSSPELAKPGLAKSKSKSKSEKLKPAAPKSAASQSAAFTRLRDVLAPGETRIDFTYDFAGNRGHDLIVSDVRAGDPFTVYPRFITGDHCQPLEDCGGIPGFYEMPEVSADLRHPGRAESVKWLSDCYADGRDILAMKNVLDRAAAQGNAAAKRVLKPAND
jgi:hypothetical protein